jgi:hypothetical protein
VVPWGFKFIENELQTQVHPSAAGPYPVAQKWEKNFKKISSQTLPVPAVPKGFKFIEKCCKHEPMNQLQGLNQGLKNEKKIQIILTKTLPVPAMSWGFKFIEKKLQIQVHPLAAGPYPMASEWLINLEKITSHTLPVPAVPRGFKFIEIKMQARAHKSAVGPSPQWL